MISIIVPAYNAETYVSDTIECLLKQISIEYEIIIVDDGSQDGTYDVLKKYASEYPEIIRVFHKQNEGVTKARLYGVQKARGEYIGFVDSDDMIESNMFSILLKNMQKYDACISHCGYKMIFDDGRIHYFHNTEKLVVSDKSHGLEMLLKGDLVEPGLCNKLYKKILLERLINGQVMDCSIRINEDLLMNFYLFSWAKTTVFEDLCLYCYRVRKNSVSRAKLSSNKIYDPIKVKKIIMDKADSSVQEVAQSMYIKTCISVYNTICINGIQEYKDDSKRIRKLIIDGKVYCKGRREKIIAMIIQLLPSELYRMIYNIYSKRILNNKYE